MNNHNKRIIGSAIKQRYSPIANYGLIKEEDWLKKVQKEIIKRLKNQEDSISHRILSGQAKSLIEETLKNIKNTKELNKQHSG